MPESNAADKTNPPTTAGMVSRSDRDVEIPTELFKGQDIKRSDTPETLLTEFSNRPDITMTCDQCGIFIDIRSLPYHRAYHDALVTMKYQLPHRPINVVSLLNRRNLLLQRMKIDATDEKPIRINDINKINEAYELLKSDLEDVYEEIKQIREKVDIDVKGVSLNCSPPCVQAVGMCSCENGRWKSYMEDTKVYQDYFGEDRNKCYFAIFDGHHGISSAERCANEMHHLLLSEMAKFDSKTKSTMARNFAESATARTDYELLRPETRDSYRTNLHQDSTEMVQGILDACYQKYDSMMKGKDDSGDNDQAGKEKKTKPKNPFSDKMQKAFQKTYYLMDILLSYGKDELSKVRWSGTSALNMVIQNTKLSETSKDDTKLACLAEEDSDASHTVSEGLKISARGKEYEPPEELGFIHVANAGSSRAILVRDNKTYRLTKDHTPYNPKEKSRVLKAGGNFSKSDKDCRLNGVLSVTRGLGNHGDKKLKDCVVVDPHVTSVPVDQYAQFLVLASRGVWEVFSDEEVASLLLRLLPSQHIPLPSKINDSVRDLFDDKENRGEDDKTPSQQMPTTAREGRVSFSDMGASQQNDTPRTSKDEQSQNGSRKTSLTGNKTGDDQQSEPKVDRLDVEGELANVTTLADLRTEVGSRTSKGDMDDDASLKTGTHLGLEEDFISRPEHSNFKERVPQTVEEKSRELAKNMAEHLIQAALMAKAKDNITVMVVLLPACTF